MPDGKSDYIYIYTPEYSSENLPEYTSDELPEYICQLERQNICQINVSWRGSLDEHVLFVEVGEFCKKHDLLSDHLPARSRFPKN